MKEENKKRKAKKLIREFNKIHSDYSSKRRGLWASNWKQTLKFADLKNGHWFWKGFDLAVLYNKYVRN